MNVIIKLDKEYDPKEVSETIESIFTEKASFAEYKVKQYRTSCEKYEKKYKLKSDEFFKKFEAGELGDGQQYFDWFAAKQGLKIWLHKYNILKGISISGN
ncbi:hypothetical protein ACFL52_02115 [Candidatus Margulisiibacteriota bacterium]